MVDGITIGVPASFQQTAIARTQPGKRLPGPSQIGILTKEGEPVLGFGSKGNGMHQRTFQGLLNFTRFGKPIDEAVGVPDFFTPARDPQTGRLVICVPEGHFPYDVLEATGYPYQEIPVDEARSGGEGVWVGISRAPERGRLRAASHTRSHSAALAY